MKIFMNCGIVGDNHAEYDKGKAYEIGAEIPEKEAKAYIDRGLGSYYVEPAPAAPAAGDDAGKGAKHDADNKGADKGQGGK